MRNPTPFIQKMDQAGIMPIFFNPEEKICLKLLEAAYEGGIRVIEMVNRGKEAPSIFPAIRKLADQMQGLTLGIGTIYHPWEAEMFAQLGAEFIVAPVMNPKLGEYCKNINLPWIPGCGTVTEVFFASELGAELVKIYPANVLTPEFVKSVHAVLPTVEIIPTGGVEPNARSIQEWFDAGVLCVGMGSQLFKKELIAQEAYSEISKIIKEALALIKEIKK